MNQRAKPHAAPRHPAPSSGTGRAAAKDGAEGSTGARPSRGGRLIPRRDQGKGARSRRIAAAPAPPPLLLASPAPRRRHAPPPHAAATRRLTVPGPRRLLLTLPSPPAFAGLQLLLGGAALAGRPEARRCLRLHQPLTERRAPLPRSAPSARGERGSGAGCEGRGRGRGESGAVRSLPLLAGGGGRGRGDAAGHQGLGC